MRYNPTFSPLFLPRDRPRRSPACKHQTSFPTTATKSEPAFLDIPIEPFNIHHPRPFHSSSALRLARSRPFIQLNSGSTCLDPTLYCLLPLVALFSSWIPILYAPFPLTSKWRTACTRRRLTRDGLITGIPQPVGLTNKSLVGFWPPVGSTLVRMAVYPSSIFDSLAYTRLERLLSLSPTHLRVP